MSASDRQKRTDVEQLLVNMRHSGALYRAMNDLRALQMNAPEMLDSVARKVADLISDLESERQSFEGAAAGLRESLEWSLLR